MSSRPTRSLVEADDAEFRAALITRCRLPSAAVDEIVARMKSLGVEFGDAAEQLGLVSGADVEDARAYAGMINTGDTPSLVQTALNKLASMRKDVVVRQHPPVTPGPKLFISREPYNPRSEKVRALRTQLLLQREATAEAAALAIVSASPGEGRSQLAAELAISFAQLGQRTILIDADLRNPQQHMLFGVATMEAGLSEAIVGGVRPMMHPVIGLPHLWLLSAGAPTSNPLELLSDGRFQELISTLRHGYDFLVIDTPPLAKCSDALAIATLAGGVLFIARANHSTYAAARTTLRALASTQAHVLGAVLNHF